MISKEIELATFICKKLFDEGYTAYFAGGWVRDLLLKKPTDEIDIATSAPPWVIEKLFEKTIPVGAFFGVMIVVLEGINFEVTTFRKDHPYLDGRHPESVDFSTPEKDAQRRDFTINGMFYDPLTEVIYDFVHGQEDLKKEIIRAIGNPEKRFQEDRLRMIRAVRFSSKLQFEIEEATEKAIEKEAPHLFPSVSIERVLQEFHKMRPLDVGIVSLHRLGLLQVIFPSLQNIALNEIEKRVQYFKYFPKETPTLIYLLELFPKASLEEATELGYYLKTTSKDIKWIHFFFLSRKLFKKKEIEPFEWALFYADPHHELFLEVEAAKILPPKKLHFLNEHASRKKELKTHIERLEKKEPLVTSHHLKKRGVQPGKKMGLLLKQAIRLSVNEDLHSADEVLEKLKNEISDL